MIGKKYRVKLIPKFFHKAVQAASPELKSKYPTYADLHNKEVVVMGRHPQATTKNSYRVALALEGDDYWFTLDKKYLVPIKVNTACTCATKTLMCQGCQCGAFTREKNKQAEKEDAKSYCEPW